MTTKSWSGGASGTWGNGNNWTPTGLPAAGDDVVVSLPVSISGNGVSSSLTIVATDTLGGAFATSTLNIGSATASGYLTFTSGALAAASANILFGPLLVQGAGTKLTVSGQLTLGGPRSVSATTANSLVVSAYGAAQLGGVSMVSGQGGNGIAVADNTAAVEIGTLGGAALGKITVDPGRSVIGAGSLVAPFGVINSGTITASGGTLSISGGVSGSGQLQIASGATLYMLTGSSNAPIAFIGSNAVLEMTLALGGGLTETGQITGFAPGDQIWFASGTTVTAAVFKAVAGGGTLSLMNGAAIVGTLTLLGNYAGYTFQVTANPAFGWNISAVQTGSGGTAYGGSPGTDSFAWIATGGSWSAAANWQDTTTLTNGVAVPGQANPVLLTGPSTGTQTITGPGQAATLTAKGNTTLSGNFNTGALTVGDHANPAQLLLAAGSSLVAQNATVAAGGLSGTGPGTHLLVPGTLVLGGVASAGTSTQAAETLSLTSGAAGQVGALQMQASPGGTSVTVDAGSSLDIGTSTAKTGTITIDANKVLIGAGLVLPSGGIINSGTISAQWGSLQIAGAVTGSGQTRIGYNATLYLYGGVSTEPVTFTGPGGTLELTLAPAGGLTSTGAVNGFAPGDKLFLASSVGLTAATYTATGFQTGTLTLSSGGTTVGTLPINGDFSYESFKVSPHGTYGTDVTLVPQFTSPDPLFDATWYVRQHPDVAASGIDPYTHYLDFGWQVGWDPNPYFHTSYYLNQNPDVAAAGIDPLLHYENSGWKEGRDPSILFSTSGYLQANSDVAASGMAPLTHFLLFGEEEGRTAVAATPHTVGAGDPLVDATYYYAQHPDVAAYGLDAATHYANFGWKVGWNPDALFDTNYYLSHNRDVAATGMDPLTHYELFGWKEGRDPSAQFSTNKYLAAHPDVKAAGVDPLIHYLDWGGKAAGYAIYAV